MFIVNICLLFLFFILFLINELIKYVFLIFLVNMSGFKMNGFLIYLKFNVDILDDIFIVVKFILRYIWWFIVRLVDFYVRYFGV